MKGLSRVFSLSALVVPCYFVLLTVFPVNSTFGMDDHGDTQADATPVVFSKKIHGKVNGTDDIDYFSFKAQRGKRYKVVLKGNLELTVEYEQKKSNKRFGSAGAINSRQILLKNKVWIYFHNPLAKAKIYIKFSARSKNRNDYFFTLIESKMTWPSPRADNAMAYDTCSDSVLLFGGASGTLHFRETWKWDGSDWNFVTDKGPGRRSRHAMAYDADRDNIVLFGGKTTTVNQLGDTWTWDGTSWTKHQLQVSPPRREGHTMVYDPLRKVIVLYGGYQRAGDYDEIEIYFNDIWQWDGSQWTMVMEETPYRPRSEHVMVWMPDTGQIVVHGGHNADNGVLREIWTWVHHVEHQRTDRQSVQSFCFLQ